MRAFLLIPVWLLTLVIRGFLPPDHPLHQWDPTLDGWVRNATDLAVFFGAALWITGLDTIIVFIHFVLLHNRL